MNKSQLVESVAKKTGLSRREATVGIDSAFELISKELKRGGKITLTGFGTFDVGKRRARAGVNPRTGAKIKIGAARMPRFRPSRALKKDVRK
ncbi:MAG: HU family DNA-binding protein [Candidatus Berkelbacteria bacterium]|nr:HU family DNA-binding protein [Candidatus Berkelbacteria bacterium]